MKTITKQLDTIAIVGVVVIFISVMTYNVLTHGIINF
jgi:hypothetical protein